MNKQTWQSGRGVSAERWGALCGRLGLSSHDGFVVDLRCRYSEPQRAYHTLQHLEECLALLDETIAFFGMLNADMIEVALWFHDAVYDPRAADNEEKSAELLAETVCHDESQSGLIAEAARLILVTKHHRAEDPAAQWLVDIDLAILGQAPVRFAEYEDQIRAEYAWVPLEVYREKRAEILRSFLSWPFIYKTELFRARFESQARRNLEQLLSTW